MSIRQLILLDSDILYNISTCLLRVTQFNLIKHGVFYRTQANIAEPDQTPKEAAPGQVLHCLLTKCTFKCD